jgi:hypothetical protein
MERLSREFERFMRTSPERSRLIITAFAANKGVSCSARPGCAGAKDDDDGDRGGGELAVSLSSDDEDEERELSSEALLGNRGVSASSATPNLSTETVRPATEPRAACRARGDTGAGAARRESGDLGAGVRASCLRATASAARASSVTAAGDSRSFFLFTPPRTLISSDSSSSLPRGAAARDRDRKGQYFAYMLEGMCQIVVLSRPRGRPTRRRGSRARRRRTTDRKPAPRVEVGSVRSETTARTNGVERGGGGARREIARRAPNPIYRGFSALKSCRVRHVAPQQ